ncbi:MAG: PAS domain S-box protein [Candidatus Heimdallarchaeaceae archaeon]
MVLFVETLANKLLNMTDTMFVLINTNQSVERVNQKTTDILGYSQEDLIGNNWFDVIFPKEKAKQFKRNFKAIIDGKTKPAEFHEVELTAKNRDKKTITFRNSEIRDENNNITHILLSGEDITESTKIRKELEEREWLLSSIIKNSPLGFVAFEGADNIVITNPALEEMVGYSHEELKETTLIGITYQEDVDFSNEMHNKMNLRERTPASYEKRYIKKNGSIVDARIVFWGTFDNEDNLLHNCAIIEDITDQKRARIALIESEQKFLNIYDSSPFGMHLYELQDNGELILMGANKAAEDILGANHQNFLGKTIEEAFPDLIETEVPERYKIAAKDGISWKTDRIDYDEGEIRGAFEVQAFQTSPNVMIASFKDITENKQMEEQLLKERDFSNTLLNIVGTMVVLVDKSEKIELINQRAVEILGYTEEEMIGKNWFEIVYPEDEWDELKISFQAAIKGESEPIDYAEREIIAKNGERKIIAFRNVVIRDKDGSITHILGSGQDITEQKKAEQALEENEEKYRMLVNNIPDSIILCDLDGSITYANENAANMHGYDNLEEFMKKKIFDSVADNELEKIKANFGKIITGEQENEVEYQMLKKDGSPFLLKVRGISLLDDQGNPKMIMAIGRDITEKKELEEELKRSEYFYRTIFEISESAITISDEEGVYNFVNQKSEELYGLSKEDLVGKKKWFDFLTEDEYDRIVDFNTKRIKDPDSVPAQYESKIVDNNGTVKNVLINVVINPETKEKITSLMDITELKKAEDELRISENLYRTIFEVSGTAFSIANEEGIHILINAKGEELYGFTKEEIENKLSWREFLHKDEVERIVEISNKRRENPDTAPSQYETRIVDKHGNVKNVLVNAKLIPESNNSIASLMDITELKEAEKYIRENEEKFRSVFDYSNDGYLLSEVDETIIDINPILLKIFGYQKSEVIGKNLQDIDYIADMELESIFEETIPKDHHLYLETVLKRKDGSILPVDLYIRRIELAGREVIFTVIRDLTLRKEAERALIDSEYKLRNLVENVPIAITIMSDKGEILDINSAHWQLFGYDKLEVFLQTKTSDHWVNMKDRERMYILLAKKEQIQDYEVKLRKGDGSIFWGSISAITFRDTSGETIYYQILQDITTQKEVENELRQQTMRYKIEETNLYLVEEEISSTSAEVFNELMTVGYEGIIFSRRPEKACREEIGAPFDFFKLSEKGTGKVVPPILEKIESVIEELPNKRVILIDRLDYLVQKNGFESTLFFIYRLMDIAYLANHIILVSIDSSTLQERQKSLLRKELKFIETKREGIIPEDLHEVLVFIYQENMTDNKPKVSDVMQELHISRPTARKRIQSLIDQGYIAEIVKGRSKVHQITQKGRIMF